MPQKPWLANDFTIRDRVALTNPYRILSNLAGAIGLPAGTAQMSNRQFRWPRFSNLRRPGNRPVLTTHYLTCTPEERYAQRRLLLQELNPEREIPFRLTATDTLPPNDVIVAFGPWDFYLDPVDAGWGVRSLNWSDYITPVAIASLTGALHYEDGPNARQRAQVIEQAATNPIVNPSFEIGLAGWVLTDAGAPSVTVTRVSTYYKFGSYSVEIANQTPNEDSYYQTVVACAATTTYTITAWVNIPDFTAAALLNRGLYVEDGLSPGAFVPITAETVGWVRLEITYTTSIAAANLSIRLYAPHAICYWDGIQVEQSGYASTYLDGSLGPGYTWAGTPHGSISTRAATQFNMDSKVSLISNQSKLTFRAVVRMPYDHDAGVTGWPNAVNCNIFDIRGANDNDRYAIWFDVVNELWRVYINGAIRISSSVQTFSAGDWLEFIFTLDFDNDVYTLFINNVADGTSTAILIPATGLTQWQLGSNFGAATTMGNFWFAEFDVFYKILTAGERTVLYAQGSGHLRARYLNCITEMAQPLVMSGVLTDRGDVSTLSVDEDVRWRSRDGDLHVTGVVLDSYNGYITVDSDDYVMPVINLKPTTARAAQHYNYRVDVFVVWKGDATNLYPIILKSGWNTAVPIGAAKMKANGDDLRVFVDGVETKRWITGIGGADTRVMINMDFQATVSSYFTVAAGAAETHLHLNSVANFPNSGMAYIINAGNSEVVSWTGRDLVNNTLTGVKRGLKGTAGFNHAPTVSIWWMQHDVVMVYGDNTASPPNADNQNRPIFDLASSTNDVWSYLDYGSDGIIYYRPYSWQWTSIKEYVEGGVTYPVRYTANHATDADPWSEIGQHNLDSGGVADVESRGQWMFYHPLRMTNIIFQDAEKRSTVGPNMEGSVDSSPDGITWTPIYAIQNVAVPGAWEAWNGLPRTVAMGANKWARVYGLGKGATHMYLEVSDCDVTIDASYAPDVFDAGEQINYQIDLFIENVTNGDLMKVFGNLFLNDTIQIDCYNREVILVSTALRQNSLVTIYSEEMEWFRLERGLNTITFTTVDPGQINTYTYWHRREWE